MLSHPVLAENSLFKLVGEIFHPLFELFGLILAGLYAVWPNYGFAITGLTIIIMLALTARRLLRCRPFGPHGVDLVPVAVHAHEGSSSC